MKLPFAPSPFCVLLHRALTHSVVLLLACAGLQSQTAKPVSEAQASSPYRPHDPQSTTGFEHFYNVDYDHAVENFQHVVDKYPDDAFAVNHLLTAVLFRELYRMGALNTGEYASDSFINAPHHNADPKAKQQIKQLVDRALHIEEKLLDANARDVDALYARGVTRAQFSTYTALIEHAWFSALRNAVGARHDHEKVLELSPNYSDAKLVVGAHNYVLGSLPWAVKVSASIIGLSGSKDKGLHLLEEAAAAGGESAVDAKFVLILFYRREHRYWDSLTLVRSLSPVYPQNSLLALEEGNLLRALDKPQEAEAAYRRIWQQGRQGHYPGQHYELAAVSLGDLLRGQKDYAGAATAYDQVDDVAQLDPEIKQRASLASGEMYDQLRKRDVAMKKYQEVIAVNSGNEPAETARKRLKEAYKE